MGENDLNIVKASFEAGVSKAPDGAWSAVSDRLDSASLDEKVKQSFESTSQAAPLFDFGLIQENPIDELVKNSFEQTRTAAPKTSWEHIFDGLEVDSSWEKIVDKIVVKSTAWRTMAAAACLAILFAVIPNALKDGEFQTFGFLASDYEDLSIIEVKQGELSDLNQAVNRFSVAEVLSTTVRSFSGPVSNGPKLSTNNTEEKVLNQIDLIRKSEILNLNQEFEMVQLNAAPIEKGNEKINNRWSAGFYVGINRTWIHDNISRNAFDKNSTLSSKFVVGDMLGLSAGFKLKKGFNLTANLFKATSRNKIGLFDHGNYIFQENEVKYFKLNLLLGKSLLLEASKVNLLLKAGPSFAYVISNATTIENKLVTFNEGYKRFNLAANVQAAVSYKFSNLIIEGGFNSELGLRNLFEGNTIQESNSNFTNNMDLGLYTSVRYQF
jgi:hypothetical protein